jgi:hypothetical protein
MAVAANKDGVVTIHGKQYRTVALRVSEFRDQHPDWTIETQLIFHDDVKVIMKALIMDGEKLLATGYAEEVRAATSINATSALEVAETSAIGRALASLGLAGTEYASADEMVSALTNQKIQDAVQKLIDHNDAWKRHEDAIHHIKNHLAAGELAAAWEAMLEIPDEDRVKLRVAPTKGGCFTVSEMKLFDQARNEDFDPDKGVYKSVANKGNGNE